MSLKHLALCHNVVRVNGAFIGPSPDEICLVGFAKEQGVEYLEKDDNNVISLGIKNKKESFRLLYVMEFSSERKRMSVVVEKNEEIFVLTKGADNVMERRMEDGGFS